MINVDKVYKTLNTIINKENNGYVSPEEFNLIGNTVQLEIFRGYFEDENRDKNKENRGLTNKGYSNLDFNERQRIDQFAEEATLSPNGNFYDLPDDLYFMEDDGLYTVLGETQEPVVIEEVERFELGYLQASIASASETYPIYERFSDRVRVFPDSISKEIFLRYIRTPKMPKWTAFTLSDGNPVYNPAAIDHQDFELHESEFPNLVVRILSYFGINLRESEVVQIAETLKDKNNVKDNG